MKKILIIIVAVVLSACCEQTQSTKQADGDSLSVPQEVEQTSVQAFEEKQEVVDSMSVPQGVEQSSAQYVDLGLSVKWATCNVGAKSSWEYGNYYAWGETKPKKTYDWSTYKYCCYGSDITLTKYCTKSSNGTVDNKTVLEKSDDVAYATFGGKWRMPTEAEWTELRTKCNWTWVTYNGVTGYKVEASNGNSIFLPAAGCRYESSIYDPVVNGYYWSSSLYESDPNGAWGVIFDSYDVLRVNGFRYYGQSVRLVHGS